MERHGFKCCLIDCGGKKNIIQGFLDKGMGVTLFPYDTQVIK